MIQCRRGLICLAVILSLGAPLWAADDGYRDYDALKADLEALEKENPTMMKLESMGVSRGGLDIWLMRVAAGGAVDPDKRPAMFIGANIEGNRLLGSEAAMATLHYLASHADDEQIKELLASRTFYIAPLLNPDVSHFAFAEPLHERGKNLTPTNDDQDLREDEDSPEDLNGDGFITMMRVKRPDGEYIPDPDDPRLMRKADKIKGERGVYKLMTEGADSDGDGKYNEDPVGGVFLNANFPHDFQHFADGTGLWPASEQEAIALIEFFINHRNIALVFTFSAENNLLNLQRGKGQAKIGAAKVKVPERMARFVGLDPEQEYTIKEIVDIVKTLPFAAGMDITEEMVAGFLGLGPVMSIPDDDYAYYEEISKRYKKMVEEQEVDDPSRAAKPATGNGSFITWAYFHYGVPSFTVDLWAVPKEKEEKEEEGSGITVEKLKEMTQEEFLALEKEKIELFLKEQEAPENIKADMVINMVRNGMVTPKRMAEMIEQRRGASTPEGKAEKSYILKWAEENVPGGGFVPWTLFQHPDLGEVEIGGMKPYISINPPIDLVRNTFEPNAEFAVKLAAELPSIEISDVSVSEMEKGIYEVTAFVRNKGFLPTAMRQGVSSRNVSPVILRLEVEDKTLLSGQRISRVQSIPGMGISKEFRWVVRADKGTSLRLTASSVKSGSDSITIELN